MLIESLNPAVLAALADPIRLRIVDRLASGECTVGELAAPFDVSQPAISRHIRVLTDAGIVVQRVDGARRPCRLAPESLAALDAWLTQLRKTLSAQYDRLDAVLAELEDETHDP
ncbi:ArsR family transcriptional regulator [Loktanella sp. 3ANDIMAR09]|uniref:ArsR/SmtB family transcription factor n=1 Tax=Loktanella sp. 3ANDIMAR09 TaxID=1225657 RepID=UPI000707960C|nr:metalloregulator ArsR/SmtB family transcription factor [Loktanella sp. 3ANDIMAR09]KQI69896.1 ArsR family transcriptional regulator [Loktanella sp. 3ANDIMAR09]